jgi:hypothetical protein
MLIKGKRTLAVCGIALVVLTGCNSDDKGKELAASKALAKIIVGGTLGDCLNIVGYDVDPSHVKNGTIPASGDHWCRVGFQNEKAPSKFIHGGVNTDTGQVVAYKQGDKTALAAVGRAINGPVLT